MDSCCLWPGCGQAPPKLNNWSLRLCRDHVRAFLSAVDPHEPMCAVYRGLASAKAEELADA